MLHQVDKLGEWTSPANVTAGGNLYQHALWTGVRYTTDKDGDGVSPAPPQGLWVSSLDAAMACPVLNKLADRYLPQQPPSPPDSASCQRSRVGFDTTVPVTSVMLVCWCVGFAVH